MPSPIASSAGHREEGTASVELIAAVPFLLLAVLVAAQLALAGQALWSAGVAARAGARAALVGGDAKAVALAGAAVGRCGPAPDRRRDGVAVRVAVPRLLPALPRSGRRRRRADWAMGRRRRTGRRRLSWSPRSRCCCWPGRSPCSSCSPATRSPSPTVQPRRGHWRSPRVGRRRRRRRDRCPAGPRSAPRSRCAGER